MPLKVLNESITPRAGALAILAAILWGGNSVSIKLALVGLPPIALAGVRFLIGSLVVIFLSLLNGISLRMEACDRLRLFLLSLLFLAQILLLNLGTHHTLASRSIVLITIYPFFTALFAHIFVPGDRLSRLKVFGMVLSFSGVVLIFGESLKLGDFSNLSGDIMVLGSGILLGARQVYSKRLTQAIHPYKLLLWQSTLSLPFFILLSALFEGGADYRFDPTIIVAILYQGLVVAGFCFVIHTTLLRRYSASRLGVFGFCTPVFGVLLSDLLLHETISPGLLASMILVGAGIAIVNREQREEIGA